MSELTLMKPGSAGGVPSGVITLWSGAATAIPTGWALCNGANGTPDLRDRFVVGAGSSYAVGATGGANTVILTTEEMPSHSHSIQGGSTIGALQYMISGKTAYNTYANSQETTSTGDGGAHENRPPYYALCYIMKT